MYKDQTFHKMRRKKNRIKNTSIKSNSNAFNVQMIFVYNWKYFYNGNTIGILILRYFEDMDFEEIK